MLGASFVLRVVRGWSDADRCRCRAAQEVLSVELFHRVPGVVHQEVRAHRDDALLVGEGNELLDFVVELLDRGVLHAGVGVGTTGDVHATTRFDVAFFLIDGGFFDLLGGEQPGGLLVFTTLLATRCALAVGYAHQ